MSLSLYNIQTEYLQLAEAIISNGGEVSEEMETALAVNKENLQNKAVNYGFVCKELEAQTLIIEAEIERLQALKKSRGKTIDRLKDTLSGAMQLYGVEEIKTPVIKLSFRKSQTVEIDNMAQLDAKFIVEKTTQAPDKKAIKAAIDSGEEVTGARIQDNLNLQIK